MPASSGSCTPSSPTSSDDWTAVLTRGMMVPGDGGSSWEAWVMRGKAAGSWVGRVALVGVIVTLASTVAPSAASAATATLAVSPNWGLGDGQTVTVTATHYPANASLDLAQCDIV